jgi:hypothetical protein
MKRSLFFCLLSSFVFSSCHFFGEGIRGNGNIKSGNHSVGSFSSVSVGGNIDLYITQGTAQAVRVETDENLLEYIEVRVNGDRLEIRPRDHFNLDPSKDIKVYVSAPEFKNLDASGACDIYSQGKIVSTERLDIGLSGASHANLELNAPVVKAGLSGAGSVELKGETREFNVNGSGSSEIRCYELKAENVDVDISGAGDAEVFASVSLKVDISGAGTVKYKGNAAVSQHVSGAGSVRKVD